MRSQGTLAFGRDIPSNGPDVRLNRTQIGPTPFLSLGPGSSIDARDTDTRGREVDLELFARDPDEFIQTFYSTPHGKLRSLLSTPRLFPSGEQLWMVGDLGLPSTLLVPYTGSYPTSIQLGPIDASSFWLAGNLPTLPSAWTAPGSDPLGYGSIKAIHVATHDPCEFRVSVQDDVFTSLRKDLPKNLLGSCGTSQGVFPISGSIDDLGVWLSAGVLAYFGAIALRASVKDVQVEDFAMTSFLRSASTDPAASGGAEGGFALRGSVELRVDLQSLPFGLPVASTPCIADFAYEYTFALDDGRLVARPREVSYSDFGGAPFHQVCNALKKTLQGAFLTQIPDRIATTARNQQLFDFKDAGNGVLTRCDASAGPAGQPSESCLQAANNLLDLVEKGYARLRGLASWALVPPAERALVDATWKAGADTLTDNWTCVDRNFVPNTPSCEARTPQRQCAIVLRAQELVNEPGAVDLKWFSADPGTITQAQLLYALLLASGPGSIGRLCNRPPVVPRGPSGTALNFSNAYSATSLIPSLSCSTRVGRGFGPDHCCTTDANCLTNPPSQVCDIQAHRCKSAPDHVCTSDINCFDFEWCDTATQRCEPIPQPPKPCPDCARCNPSDPFAPSICPGGTFCQDSSVGLECRR